MIIMSKCSRVTMHPGNSVGKLSFAVRVTCVNHGIRSTHWRKARAGGVTHVASIQALLSFQTANLPSLMGVESAIVHIVASAVHVVLTRGLAWLVRRASATEVRNCRFVMRHG